MIVKEKGGVWIATDSTTSTPSSRIRGFSTTSRYEAEQRCFFGGQGFSSSARFKREDTTSARARTPKPNPQVDTVMARALRGEK